MKNLYLLLLLLLFSIGNAQTPVSNYALCDDDNDGVMPFNLNEKSAEIMANFNVAEHLLQYYRSLADAQSASDPISLASTYNNISNPQQVFARVTNIQTLESSYFSFNLIVNPRPIAFPASLTFCDPTELPIYNLDDAIPQILGNQQNMTVVFYDSPSGGSIIAGGTFVPTAPVMVLGAQIYNGTCASERTTITLNTNNCNSGCPQPSGVVVTLQADNETINMSWNFIPGVLRYEIFIVPVGAPAPTAASVPTVATTSTSSVLTGLVPNTCYSLYIRAVCDQSGSNIFTEWVGPTQVCTNPCQAPTNISVDTATITPYSARVIWTSTAQAANHQVYLVPAGGPAPTVNSPGGILIPVTSFPHVYNMTGLLPGYCYDIYIRTVCDANTTSLWAGPMTFCTFGCVNAGNCVDNLTLIAFLDDNNNGTMETGEAAFTKGSFAYERNDSGTINYGSSNYGIFLLTDNNPANLYDLSYVIDEAFAPYYSTAATYNNINIPTGGGTNTYYFPVRLLQNYNNLEIELIVGNNPRPGFTYTNIIKYKNTGTAAVSLGTIAFTKDNVVTILSVSELGIVSTSNGFTYAFSNLLPGEERTITVTMLVPTIPTVALGQTLTHSVAITPVDSDILPANNSATLTQIIVGSYDPNDKSEAHGGKVAMDTFTSDDYLTYTIRFENTGTASAEFIRVEDLLDAGLNPDTVVMLNASHPYNMRKLGNKLIWNFYDVNLPPTATNPTESHGFIQFKVKPTSGYAVGTVIPNAADIYFDFNPAIVTDSFQTQFVATLSSASFIANAFYFHPNPARTFVRFALNDPTESIAKIEIRDVLGKSVKVIEVGQSDDINVDVSRFSKGIYFVEMTTVSQINVTKKLIVD